MLGITTVSYSMDSAALIKSNKKKEDAVYRAICERRFFAEDTEQDLTNRVRAACRIYATRGSGDQLIVYEHMGMQNGYLRSSEGDRYAWVSGNDVVIRHETPKKLYSITIIQMPEQIVSCAFNDNGTVFASVTAHELYVSDVVCNCKKESQLLLERSLNEIQHVALSPSGNTIAVGVKQPTKSLRFMVFDTQKNELLHDLPGVSSPDMPHDCSFFYMMNDDVIATCSTVPYKQYDLEAVRALATLTEEQKGLILRVYKYLKRRKKRMCLQWNSELFDIYTRLPSVIKTRVSKLVRFEDC